MTKPQSVNAVESAEEGSVSRWLPKLPKGDGRAQEEVFSRYFDRLSELAHKKLLGATIVRHADGNDVASQAFERFFAATERGAFHELKNRQDLWKALVSIATHIAVDAVRSELAIKRGKGGTVANTDVAKNSDSGRNRGPIENCADVEPAADVVAAITDEIAKLLAHCNDEMLSLLVDLRSAGCSDHEIAKKTKLSVRTIQRRFAKLRSIHKQLNTDSDLD